MNISYKTILITGANRGIGQALLNEALARGAKRIYAGMRTVVQHSDPRVTHLALDVTSVDDIQRAAAQIGELDLLINNAGIAKYDDLTHSMLIEEHFDVNFFGVFRMTQAFLPHLKRSRGAIVNNLSLAALAPLPVIRSHAISIIPRRRPPQPHRASTMGWRAKKRRSSPIRCRSKSPKVGATASPKRLSANSAHSFRRPPQQK